MLDGIVNPDLGKNGGNNWTRSGGRFFVRGGMAGFAGGLANQVSGWAVDQYNKLQERECSK